MKMDLAVYAILAVGIVIALTNGSSVPNIVNATVGDTVTIPCIRAERTKAVEWIFRNATGFEERLFELGRLIDNHAERYDVTLSASDDYILIIPKVRVSDSGTYICIEENGVGRHHSTILFVLDSAPEDDNIDITDDAAVNIPVVIAITVSVIVVVLLAIAVLFWFLIRNNKLKPLRTVNAASSQIDEIRVPLAEIRQQHHDVLHTLNTTWKAVGVTVIDDMIYVITERPNVISVFSSQQPYSPHPGITVDGMKLPVDIVAWAPDGNKALWIADFEERCVWKVSVDGNECRRVWSPTMGDGLSGICEITPDTGTPCSLSSVSDGLAIATTSRTFVRIVGSDGQSKQPTYVDRISLWLYAGITPQLSIKTINILPEVNSISTDTSFVHRFHVSFDSQGRCFCCDRAQNCVYILSADLSQYRMLLCSQDAGLVAPIKLHYSQSDGSLWVCDGNSVKLFRVTEEQITDLLTGDELPDDHVDIKLKPIDA